MSKRTIRQVIDLTRPPALTARQRAQLEDLKAMPAGDIDTSDIAPLTEDFWRKAVRNPFLKPAIPASKRLRPIIRRRSPA